MEYARLGNTGLRVSRLCLGCMTYGDPKWRPWILGEGEARAHFKKALELGINFFDTADMYSAGASEEVTGKMLRELASRDDYVLATKVFFPVAEGPKPGVVSPIVGATRIEHLEELAAACEIEFSHDEMAQLEAPYQPHPIVGHDQRAPRDFV